MRKFKFTLVVVVSFSLLKSLSGQDIFIKALGTKGDENTIFRGGSVVKGHENEIEALTYTETDTSCGMVVGAGCNTITGPWIFSMNINPSIVNFKNYMYTSRKIGSVTVHFVSPGEKPFTYYTVTMTNVFVKMVSESGGYTKPQFYIELDPSTIRWTYTEQNADGSVGKKSGFGWDRKNNVPL